MVQKIIYCLLLCFAISKSVSERVYDEIYSPIKGGAACFRRLNGTHQAGCSSNRQGGIGVVHMINNLSDVQWMLHNGTNGPYIAVLNTVMFYSAINLILQNPQQVSGILVYDDPIERPNSFTQESRCPNEYMSSELSQCSSDKSSGIVWNEHGTGLIRKDIPFPIFYLPISHNMELENITKCYNRYNLNSNDETKKPLCSLQLHSFMFAAVSSKLCIRRSAAWFFSNVKVCEPLGDLNVYCPLFPLAKDDKRPVTLVTGRIDSASLFDGLAPGAAGAVIGMTTLIAAASLLNKMIPDKNTTVFNENIVFTLFNGESFDYIGSQRVAYDISQGTWPAHAPLNATQIKLHVEVAQLGGSLRANKAEQSWPLYAFAPFIDNIPSEVNEFMELFLENLKHNNLSLTSKFTLNMPPSSIHSFRSIIKQQIPQLMIADHAETFTNNFYHSVLDDKDNVGFTYRNIGVDKMGTFIDTETLLANGTFTNNDMQMKITNLATSLAYTMYRRALGVAYNGTLTASVHMIDEVLYCLLESQNCRLLRAADYVSTSSPELIPHLPASLFVSVGSWQTSGAYFAAHLLALLAGTHLDEDQDHCEYLRDTSNGVYKYVWLRGWNDTGVCIQTTVNYTIAESPAFNKSDYQLTSHRFSTWTESVWQTMWLRVFVSASGVGATIAAISGAIATVFVAFVAYWIHKHANIVFAAPPTASVITNDAVSGILRPVNC